MLYVGLDLHYKRSTFCVMGADGNILMTREVRGRWPRVIEALEKLRAERNDKLSVVFEASSGSGHFHDQVKKVAARVTVAHPGKLRLIFQSKRKNDRVDAQKLAFLLYIGQVPAVYVPDSGVRAWRKIIEYRSGLVAKRTRVKNQIRDFLKAAGKTPPRGLWTKHGVEWMKAQEFEHDLEQVNFEIMIEELLEFEGKLRRVERKLSHEARKRPGVQLLMSIPGVGIRTAEALVAYIDDPRRFAKNKQVPAYLGLVPRLDSSAGRDRLGHITKEGPGTVRRLLTEAAWQAIRRSNKVEAYYKRVMHDDPGRKKIAIIAVAHYLARVSHAMLKNGEYWNEVTG